MPTPEIYLSIAQVCERLGVSRAAINRWRKNGTFPPARQFSPGCVRWPLSAIIEWEVSRPTCFTFALDD
jgi:predicted DNA-binding transcriptional regulator AlpA